MNTYRPAPMDKATSIVTIFVLALLVLIIVLAFIPKYGQPMRLFAILDMLIIAISWQVKANRYEVSEDSITLVRGFPFRDIIIPLAEVKKVKRATISKTTIRTCGVGGLFSNTGWFWNKETGRFFASVTDGHNIVLISNGKKYAISPENPDEFVSDISNQLAGRQENR